MSQAYVTVSVALKEVSKAAVLNLSKAAAL